MNGREIVLRELEVHAALLEEALSCVLHSLLFLRCPRKTTPEDVALQLLAPLTYAKCGGKAVDGDVKRAIESLKITLEHVGPNLSRGALTLAYFVRSELKG